MTSMAVSGEEQKLLEMAHCCGCRSSCFVVCCGEYEKFEATASF